MNRRDFVLAAAAAPLAGALAPDALARTLGGIPAPLALVTADTESRVAAVRPVSGRIVASIATQPGPRSIQNVGDELAVVAHTAYGEVSILDARQRRVIHVLRGFAAPRYTAAHPSGRIAFVTDSERRELVSLDVRAGRLLGRALLGGPARHIAIAPGGTLVWVSLGSKAERIAVVDVSDPRRPRLLHLVAPPFRAHDVGFQPGGARVWVTSGDARTLAVYGAESGRILRRLAADAPPQHVTFRRGTAYVTSGDDGTLRVHSLARGRVVRTTSIPVGSYNVQEGWNAVLTPSLERGTLCVLDAAGRLRHRVHVAESSHDACFVTA